MFFELIMADNILREEFWGLSVHLRLTEDGKNGHHNFSIIK